MWDLKTLIVIATLSVPFFVMTLWAIVNVAQKDFKTLGEKALWGLTASIPYIGFIIYFLFGSRRGKIRT